MFCKESLAKIKFRAFPKRVGPQILSLEIDDYFGTSEHYWMVEKKILISKTAMVKFCKLSLYANGLVMCMQFIFGDDWNDVSCKSLFWSPAMPVISLESRPLKFRVFRHEYSLQAQTYFWSLLTHVLSQSRSK